MSGFNFEILQSEVNEWARRNFGPGSHPGYHSLLGVMEELGELAHSHLKQIQGIRGTTAEHEAAGKDAVADIVIYLADHCATHGWDMQEIIEQTWAQVKQRESKKRGDAQVRANWVVAGGTIGEVGHCTRCGEGLKMEMPQRGEVVIAAMRAFVRVHSRCESKPNSEPPITLESWPASRYTGVSSATIFYVFTGWKLYDIFDVPHDPADFGRCYRLLKLAELQNWEACLDHVSIKFPTWAPFVREWPKLKAMYEEELRTNKGRELYDFMQVLRHEKREAV